MKTLFETQVFGQKKLRNRIVMAPMTRKQCPDGFPTQEVINYYTRRGNGGVGLIFSEGTFIDHPSSQAYKNQSYKNIPFFFGKEPLKGWEKVVKSVHKTGAAFVPQLWHVGEVRKVESTNSLLSGLGPCNIIKNKKILVKEMNFDDIQEVINSFVRGAKNAKEIGCDGVALHGAHGYLFDQFFWEETNKRDDKFGGSIINRVKFSAMVVKAIRQEVGKDFPIVFRFSQWKMNDYNAKIINDHLELKVFLSKLADAGVDWFDVSTRRFWEPAFKECSKSLVALTKKYSGKHTIAVGSVGLDQPHHSKFYRDNNKIDANVINLNNVEKSLMNKEFDLVAVGRAILSDPEWTNKVKSGDMSTIKPFIRKNLEEYY